MSVISRQSDSRIRGIIIDHPAGAGDPPDSGSTAKLCDACAKLNVQHLACPFLPCRNPLPCTTPPIDGYFGASLALGSTDDIARRRAACDLCALIAECLDKESPDLGGGGECRIRESAQFCTFALPPHVRARDPAATHVHLTQTSVILDPIAANQLHGPALPWEAKKRDARASRYILHLQTKARSCPRHGDDTAASGPQGEQEFLDTVGGRHVGTQVNARLIRAWLRECEREHGKVCTSSLQRRSVAQDSAPAFVVDVVQSCLVDTPPGCRYVALSYVWGTGAVFKHLSENTQAFRKVGALRSLPIPATIRDAIALVRAIEERYLWVDSICIVQNDQRMQQTEIMRMGLIYSKALFTIVAAAGDHANNGLPGVELGSREQTQKVLKIANCELLTVIDIRTSVDDTVWAQRAWTFQERVLSNRVLVFSESQVHWTCRVTSHSEERALEDVEDLDRLGLTFSQKPGEDSVSWEPLQLFKYCNLYDDLLTTYRQRRLTYATDILNAFNGVTEMLAATQNDNFFWGLPEAFFSYALIWDMFGHCSRNHIEVPVFNSDGSKQMVSIPSWSWAAWSGKDSAHMPDLMDGEQNVAQPLIQFSIVDSRHQLYEIKERLWRDQPGDPTLPLWQDVAEPHQHPPLSPGPSPRIGQLQFWTSFANVRVVRRWIHEERKADYTFSIPPNLPLGPDVYERPEIIHQDFIVIAGRGTGTKLILLAIKWEDGVAYRVGRTEVRESDWVQVKNRQWRFITLG